MIHKFILGRCVQCNLPQEDLERVGWECLGHAQGGSATYSYSSITDKSSVPNDNEESSPVIPGKEVPSLVITNQEIDSQERVPASMTEAKIPSESSRGKNWMWLLCTMALAVLVFVVTMAGLDLLNLPKIQTIMTFDQASKSVETWLDQEIAGHAPYRVNGVSNYRLVAYKIVKRNKGTVTVDLSFATSGAGDVHETRNFQINSKNEVEIVNSH